MTEAHARFFWLSHPDAEAPPPHWQSLHDAVYWERPSRGPDRRPLLAPAPDWADDLQRVARAVFAADRYARRADLALLGTVTGDLWEVVFRPMRGRSVRERPLTFTAEDYARDVALFSGGLDSLGWAAQQAGAPSARALLLVSFEERNFETLQDQVYEAVCGLRQRPVRRLVQSQTVRAPRGSGIKLERTTRSRGLLYAATAVHAAAAERIPVVHLPENANSPSIHRCLPPGREPARPARCIPGRFTTSIG